MRGQHTLFFLQILRVRHTRVLYGRGQQTLGLQRVSRRGLHAGRGAGQQLEVSLAGTMATASCAAVQRKRASDKSFLIIVNPLYNQLKSYFQRYVRH